MKKIVLNIIKQNISMIIIWIVACVMLKINLKAVSNKVVYICIFFYWLLGGLTFIYLKSIENRKKNERITLYLCNFVILLFFCVLFSPNFLKEICDFFRGLFVLIDFYFIYKILGKN
jgi:hypothetical protein